MTAFPTQTIEIETNFGDANHKAEMLDKALQALASYSQDIEAMTVISELRSRFLIASNDSFREYERERRKVNA